MRSQSTTRRTFLQTAGSAAGLACLSDRLAADEPQTDGENTPSDLPRWLQRPILSPELTMTEVQDSIEANVVAMPPLESLQQWEQQAERLRHELLEQVVFRGVPEQWRQRQQVQWQETIAGGPGYHIRKVRYEALPGYWIPGLLYEPEEINGRVPLVFNTHGHVGTGGGKARNHIQIRCINLAKRGLLAFTSDWPDIGQLHVSGRHYRMHQLELCGVSGLAPFYLCLTRALDFLLELPQVDPQRVGVTGLSGGGWQAIYLAALDRRVTLANPVAGYSSFRTRARHVSDLGDGEQSPPDMATITDYTHLTALVAPRPLLLTYNAEDDCCFATDHALPPLMQAAQPVYDLYGKPDHLRSHNNLTAAPEPRGHNYGTENREAFYTFLGDFFYPGDESFRRDDLPCEVELKSYEELFVPLPQPNHGFNSLAREAMRDLPRSNEPPQAPQPRARWQTQRRTKLADIVRGKHFRTAAQQLESQRSSQWTATFWKLRLDEDWTTGVVELRGPQSEQTSILLADRGRAEAAEQAAHLLKQGHRVLAVDPLNFGESQIASSHFLYSLQLAATGARLLGLQASQLTAIARWSQGEHKSPAVQVVALGPRTSVLATVAAALEPAAIGGLQLHQPMTSLQQLIQEDRLLTAVPELFCFGLLKEFDLPQLQTLVAPRPLVIHKTS